MEFQIYPKADANWESWLLRRAVFDAFRPELRSGDLKVAKASAARPTETLALLRSAMAT